MKNVIEKAFLATHLANRVQRTQKDDLISLTDIAKYKNADAPRFVIQNWMRSRSTLEFLGVWEVINNPDFNRVGFDTVKNESGRGNLCPQGYCV